MARIPTANFDTGNDTHPGKFRAILIRAAQEEVTSTDDYSRFIVVTAAVTMVLRSRRARSGGRPVSKPVPFSLSQLPGSPNSVALPSQATIGSQCVFRCLSFCNQSDLLLSI